MKRTRALSFIALLLGVLTVSLAAACGGSGGKASPTAKPATRTATPTSTATQPPTPTATATPYAGGVSKFIIPKFNVDAPVEALAVDSTNTMETPNKPYTDVAWYHIWTRPGWDGNAVFSAHIYWHSVPAPFNKISDLATGDEVDVQMADGTTYKYKVISNHAYSLSTLNMGNVIWPKDRPPDAQWITMITCAGGTAANGYDYTDRTVVVAQRFA